MKKVLVIGGLCALTAGPATAQQGPAPTSLRCAYPASFSLVISKQAFGTLGDMLFSRDPGVKEVAAAQVEFAGLVGQINGKFCKAPAALPVPRPKPKS